MSTSYITYIPDQQYLMPCALQEWLPQGHLAYFINDTVESLELKAFHARNAGGGSRTHSFHLAILDEFTELFTQVVRLACEMGLVKLGTIAVDGTKIKANASRHKAMSYGRMHSTEIELKAQIAALLKKATSTDEAEKSEPDLGIPAEIERRQARLAAIEAAKARLEERTLGGAVGAALLQLCLQRGWVEQDLDSRALHTTVLGQRQLPAAFDLPAVAALG